MTQHATIFITILTVILISPLLYYIAKPANLINTYIRRIAGIDAIENTIGASVERGRPIIFSTGLTNVSPVLYAVLGVLFYVAKKAAVYREKLIVPQYNPETMAIVEEVVKDAYISENKLSLFDPKSISFLSESQFAFASGYMGIMHRECPGAAFLFGYFAAESLLLAEAGQQVGAMQIGASVSPEQVPFFICTCDYTLIGEELFAASAYLTKEKIQLASLKTQDLAKLVFFILIILGAIIATLNSALELNLPNIDKLFYLTLN